MFVLHQCIVENKETDAKREYRMDIGEMKTYLPQLPLLLDPHRLLKLEHG